MKNMFYGEPNNWDGRCADCPFVYLENGDQAICSETEQDVMVYFKNGHINKNCPFIQKGV